MYISSVYPQYIPRVRHDRLPTAARVGLSDDLCDIFCFLAWAVYDTPTPPPATVQRQTRANRADERNMEQSGKRRHGAFWAASLSVLIGNFTPIWLHAKLLSVTMRITLSGRSHTHTHTQLNVLTICSHGGCGVDCSAKRTLLFALSTWPILRTLNSR